MNILELQINDLKRITAIEISPTTGKPVILTGDNGNGKSSVLDSIILALSNTGLDDPIRHGRPSGYVKLTLGVDKAEYLLERKVTKSGDKLTLTDAAGTAVQKPQTFLNGLLGNYAFDPLKFTRLKPKDQVEALRIAAGLDFTAIDAKRKGYYDERTAVTREGREANAQFVAIPQPAAGVPTEEVSAVDLIGNLQLMDEAKRKAASAKDYAELCTDNHASALQDVARYQAALDTAKELASDMEKEKTSAIAAMDQAVAAAPTSEQLRAASDAIGQVEETNRAVRSAAAHRELDAKLKALRLTLANLNRRIEEIDEEKKESIKNANLPLDGLELTDDGVMVSGTFFSQLSTAEQIRVSTLVAMSQNPTLKIVIIREGALMNQANLAMIAAMAAERGYQCWIEKFQEAPGDVGLHIIDGAIAFEDGEAVTAATAE